MQTFLQYLDYKFGNETASICPVDDKFCDGPASLRWPKRLPGDIFVIRAHSHIMNDLKFLFYRTKIFVACFFFNITGI